MELLALLESVYQVVCRMSLIVRRK